MTVVFTPKSLLYCPSFIFVSLEACFPVASTRLGPEIRFPSSNYSPKTQFGDGDHQKLSNKIAMTVVFTPKRLLYCPSFIFVSLVACFPGASTQFGPEIRFPISIYSSKMQFGDGDHQKWSNFIAMLVVFTPKSLLYRPSFIFVSLEACFLVASTQFRPEIRFPNSVYSPKTQFGDGDHQNMSNSFAMLVVFYCKKSDVLSQFPFFRVLWPAFRVRELDLSLKSVFQIHFTPKKRNLATVITKI